MRASAVISSVGLVGVAVGPTVAGLLLAFTPWQALLVVNAPVAVLAAIGSAPVFRPTRPRTCTETRSTFRARCSAR